jgi:hypothetical protein
LTNPRAGACWLWAEAGWCGAPCVTWVLDELVVGDNISDRVSPTMMGARSHQCSKAVQHGCWRARRLPELTTRRLVMWRWAVPTINLDGGYQGAA